MANSPEFNRHSPEFNRHSRRQECRQGFPFQSLLGKAQDQVGEGSGGSQHTRSLVPSQKATPMCGTLPTPAHTFAVSRPAVHAAPGPKAE